MSTNGVKILTKSEFNNAMTGIANEVSRTMLRIQDTYNVILNLSDADLTAMPSGDSSAAGYDSAQQLAIGGFKVALLNMIEAFNATTKTGSAVPKDSIIQMRNAQVL